MSANVLVLPCFNEEARLDPEALLRLVRADPDLDLLFVDDGSTDGTTRVIERLRAAHPGMGLIRLPENRGKAEAVRAGLQMALAGGARVVGYADADLATPPEELHRLVDQARRGEAKVYLASRVRLLGTRIERRAIRHYLGRIFATLASFALRIPVYDTQCGAKVFLRTPALDAALAVPFRTRWAFDVELLDRLLRPSGDAPGLVPGDLCEIPLRSWRDVPGSKLRVRAMLLALIEISRLLLRSRLSR